MPTRKKDLPPVDQEQKELPSAEQEIKDLPDAKQSKKAMPELKNPENSIKIGDTLVEIKPTKLKYQRNRTASFYKILELYPLTEVLAMQEGTFGDERDGDKAVMDWLIAVFDDEKLVMENYDEMDTGMIEKLLIIFKRVNQIDEKEEKLKNLARAGTTKA